MGVYCFFSWGIPTSCTFSSAIKSGGNCRPRICAKSVWPPLNEYRSIKNPFGCFVPGPRLKGMNYCILALEFNFTLFRYPPRAADISWISKNQN